MAVPTNTIQTASRIGLREDLADVIYGLYPDETPFIKMIGRDKAKAVYTEWQTDLLVAADPENANIQGDDVNNDARPVTKRVGNYTQLMDKVVGSSSTAEAVDAAGRASEISLAMAKSMRELKRDIETRASGNYIAVPPTGSVAGKFAGALAWLTTNVARGATGVSPVMSAGAAGGYPITAAVNGTGRPFAEALLKTIIASTWNAGGEPTHVILGSASKQTASTFTGIAAHRRETGNKKATIIAGADVYVSDFGELTFVPSRFCSVRDALVVDPEMWALATLQELKVEDLAKTGHAKRKMLSTEVTLKCKNEAASGVVADIV